jgi:hypothetical protein
MTTKLIGEMDQANQPSRGNILSSCPKQQPLLAFMDPAHLDTAPIWKGFGAAMSSSPWEWLWNGDEDVATPFHAGAVSRCAPND